MAPQRNSKRSFDILPEPIETSTRSVRQKMPELQANPQSHAKSFLPIPIQSSKRSHRTTAGNPSSPLTSSNLSAMLASLEDQNGSNRVSPRSLPSSACPSLSTSPGSTTSSMASFEHAHHASRHHGVNTPNVNVQLGVLDENNEEEIVGKDGVGTPATPEETSRVFPTEAPVRVGGYNIGGDARVDNKNHPHDNNNYNGKLQPTEDASGVVAQSTSARAHETQITSEDSKRVVDTPKPKNILITSTHALVESPMKKPSHFSWNKDNNIKRSPSPCLWSSPAPSRSPSPSLWCTTTSNAYRSKQAPPPPETKMSTSSSTSTSSNSTELTVPPSSSSSSDDEKVEISTSKISLWRPASQEQRAASPCLWTKSSKSTTTTSSTAKCVKVLPTYQATETVIDEPPSPSNLCPTKPCEVSCEFVQQVYRYLSFDHECMARGYDYELADISGLSMAEVKADRFNALKKYVEDYIGRVPGIRTGQGW